jgi:hypothetical protein
MRRAISPVICTTRTRAPVAVSTSSASWTLRTSASGLNAARYFDPLRAMPITRPATGARFTCTSNTERKMPMRSAFRPSGSSLSPTAITRPSAGASTASGSSGSRRGGLRKNAAKNPPSARSGSATHHGARNDATTPARIVGTAVVRTSGAKRPVSRSRNLGASGWVDAILPWIP